MRGSLGRQGVNRELGQVRGVSTGEEGLKTASLVCGGGGIS